MALLPHDPGANRSHDVELPEHRERLAAAVAASGAGTFHLDIATGSVFWDENLDRLFGVTRDATAHAFEHFIERVHPEDREAVVGCARRCAERGGDFATEYRVVWPDGTVRWLEDRGKTFRSSDGSSYMIGTCVDVTDRKRLEAERERLLRDIAAQREELEAKSRLLEAVLRHAPFGMAIAEPSTGRLVGQNAARNRALGGPGPEITDFESYTKLGLRRPDGTPLAVHEYPLARALRGETVAPEEVRLQRFDGAEGWVSIGAAPVLDDAGRLVGAVAAMEDITDKKRHLEALRDSERRERERAEELQRAEQALKAADRQKDEFLATLAHELRNPLAPIRTGLELLKQPPASHAAAEKVRTTMQRQLGHLVRLVDDLLDVSRISHGKIELQRERLQLRDVVAHAVEASGALAEASGHALAVQLPAEPIWIEGDEIRLAQVLTNLLNNAAKYTPRGGHIELAAAVEGSAAVIRVSDDGSGIAEDMLPRVFDLFAQADRDRERSQGGLGIGLSLARRLVKMHGGTITAASAGPGRGSTFTVRLPLAAGPSDAASENEPNHAPPAACRILVVDDNEDAAETLTTLLGLSGHDTRSAHDGAQALEAARAFAPDLVFLDLGLPDMSGYEVAERLRADRALEGVVLVALTGWGADEDKQRTRAAGFDLHLTKPVDLSAVEDVVARFSARRL
jgi:PAS domain S-box-containing protein